MSDFSVEQRRRNIERMKTETFDLAIVGGGITGAGIARDAASRGMKVALVEARDFAFGTSSRSSKLIHGGIRYLENLEFGLVFEALSERKVLFEIAPHLVHPLKFVLPIYRNARVGMFKMGLGMFLYDALSLFDAPEHHERLDFQETLRRLPMLQNAGLEGAYAYYDAYMDDDRLTLETHRSAFSMGAVAANYVKVVDLGTNEGRTTALLCRDEITQSEFAVRAKHFIGSVGPWTDIFGFDVMKKWNRTLRPTKGIHITLDRNRLPLKEAVVMVDDAKKRIVFGIPRHEMIIIGTTDTDYPGDPADVHSERADIDYLMSIAHEYFPGAALTERDIMASYSGVRPLVHDSSESESKTSREHKIWSDPRNFTFVAGGKYTTYRHMSEQIVDFALDQFSLEDKVRFGKPQTKVALNPSASAVNFVKARRLISSFSKEFQRPEAHVEFLVDRHGLEAVKLLETWNRREFEDIWELEAWHAINKTMCMNLDDFFIRRAPLFLARADHGFSFRERISNLFARELNWSDAERSAQIQKLDHHLKHEMGWRR